MESLTALSYDLRKDVIEIICAGKAGHIGGDMSVIDTLIALYFKQMNISPKNMDDENRDRFVMSKGHSVEALYAVLAKRASLHWKRFWKNSANSVPNLSDIRTTSCLGLK